MSGQRLMDVSIALGAACWLALPIVVVTVLVAPLPVAATAWSMLVLLIVLTGATRLRAASLLLEEDIDVLLGRRRNH